MNYLFPTRKYPCFPSPLLPLPSPLPLVRFVLILARNVLTGVERARGSNRHTFDGSCASADDADCEGWAERAYQARRALDFCCHRIRQGQITFDNVVPKKKVTLILRGQLQKLHSSLSLGTRSLSLSPTPSLSLLFLITILRHSAYNITVINKVLLLSSRWGRQDCSAAGSVVQDLALENNGPKSVECIINLCEARGGTVRMVNDRS